MARSYLWVYNGFTGEAFPPAREVPPRPSMPIPSTTDRSSWRLQLPFLGGFSTVTEPLPSLPPEDSLVVAGACRMSQAGASHPHRATAQSCCWSSALTHFHTFMLRLNLSLHIFLPSLVISSGNNLLLSALMLPSPAHIQVTKTSGPQSPIEE